MSTLSAYGVVMKQILEIPGGRRVLALLILSTLCACGQKGPLYLDSKAAPAAPAASAAGTTGGAKAP